MTTEHGICALRATLACAALMACAAATAQPRTTLAVMPPGNLTGAAEAWGLNDAGTVVGNHSTPGGASQPFVWRGTNLPPGLLGVTGSALGVGNSGAVVGSAVFAGVGLRAFSWTSAGGLRNLGVLPGGSLSFATGVDDAGRITGLSQTGSASSRAFLLEPGGTMRDLGTLGGSTSQAQAIANGLVVGSSTDASGALQAFAWTEAGGMQGIGPVAAVSEARGVNRNGLVVGRVVVGGEDLPFLWTPGDRARLLAGAEGFHGAAVNDAGQVLLRHGAGGNSMLWVEGGTPAKLHTLAGAGISNFDATAINAYAQVAGTATGSATGGVARPVLLTLHPEWQGGSGRWDGAGGAHWNWAGTGVAAATVGAMHDVVIDPDVDAFVSVGNASARTLRVGGRGTQTVMLQLDGSLALDRTATLGAGATLVGSGTLAARTLTIADGAEVRLRGAMTLDGGTTGSFGVRNEGTIRVGDAQSGNAYTPLRLPTGMYMTGGRVEVTHGEVQLGASITNMGLWHWSGNTRMVDGNTPSSFDNLTGGRVVYGAGRHETISTIGWFRNRGRIELAQGATWDLTMYLLSTGELDVAAGARLNLKGAVAQIAGATGGGGIEVHHRLATSGEGRYGFISHIEPALTLRPGAVIDMLADGMTPGAGLDKFILDGLADISSGGLRFTGITGHEFSAGDVYDLFDWNGGLSGTFASLTLPTLADGLNWDTSDLYAGGTLGVTTAVPEPAGWALMLAGGALLAGLDRGRSSAGRAARRGPAGLRA